MRVNSIEKKVELELELDFPLDVDQQEMLI